MLVGGGFAEPGGAGAGDLPERYSPEWGGPGVRGERGCGAVTTSEYSRFLGMPVALLGVGGYAVLLLGCLAALGLAQPPVMLRWALAGVAFAGFAFSAYLTGTQAFLIGSYCVYCLTSASLMTAIMALTVVVRLSERAIDRQDERDLSPPS